MLICGTKRRKNVADFFTWLSNNPIAMTVFVIVFSTLAGVILITYLIAFFEGREITFWPPKIGGKPEKSIKASFSKKSVIRLESDLREIFKMDGTVIWSRSFETKSGKRYLRSPDARASAKIMSLQKEGIKHYDEDSDAFKVFSIDRPADNLIVIGSIRYNMHAEQIQKHFDLPFEYIFSSYAKDPGNRIIRIVTEHGEELSTSKDHAPSIAVNSGVDYGILLVGNLSNGKRVYWISGIHGVGTDGAFQYLTENADEIRRSLTSDENSGICWLLRTQYKITENSNAEVVNVEALGNPRICTTHKRQQLFKKITLIFDLGNVILNFDRTRSYRAIGHILNKPFIEIQERLESTNILEQYETGQLTDDEFRAQLYMLIGDEERKLPSNILDELWGDIFWPNNEMFEVIKYLNQQRIPLILLSNTNNIHFYRVRTDYPEIIGLFDRVILSYEEKKYKPDYQLFSTAIQKAHEICAEKPEILYIDDREDYVKAADQLGMNGFVYRSHPHFIFWLRRKGLYIS